MNWGDLLKKAASAAVATAGKAIRLPEFGISERIVGKASAAGPAPKPTGIPNPTKNVQGVSALGNILNQPKTGTPTYIASTGGQSAGGGGDQGGSFDLGGGDQGGVDEGAYLNELRNAFSGLRSSIEGQLPGLENTYNTTKADIEGNINRAKETFTERQGDINKGFGTNLRSMLLSDRELGEKSRNVYSGLNALDSSSYGDSEIKRSQSLFDAQNQLTTDKERQLRESEREYKAYEAEGTRVLAQAANEYMQGKSALQQALAQNDINSAYAIQNAMQEAQARARQVQDTMNAFKLNLAQLQAQGVNVMGNLGKFGAGSLNEIMGGYQQNTVNPALSRLSIPQTSSMTGSGYIGNSRADEELKKLQGNIPFVPQIVR